MEVPHEGHLGFVILVREGIEVMLQTWASAKADAPEAVLEGKGQPTNLFLEVQDFHSVRSALSAFPVLMPERVASYGMREMGFLAPSGHPVWIATRV
ncbi:hypothetical protein [Bryobacter aggregatus]|uniref:hypothetical protein n=1 Tax=Bryobacter aggregatus TaxID=360054 RepID=UPI0004E1DFEA|nr:hypothetical protein [Bryobacter aggregatus]